MTKTDKRIQKFCGIKGEATFREVIRILRILNFKIKRMESSHFIFERVRSGRSDKITIPVHNNKVKKQYVKDIIKIIKQEQDGKI